MIEDLGAKYANAIEELKKANARIKDLEASVEELLAELKKYKQLNGKRWSPQANKYDNNNPT